jgi:tRNA (guanosine-2'-O-)-methyltransferase
MRMPSRPTNREKAEQDLARLEQDAGGPAVDDVPFPPPEIIRRLEPHVSPERMARIRDVVAARTRHIVPVVEGVANTGNVNAVMRTAEGLGLQSFHVIKGATPPKHSRRTSQGAHKWLDVTFWDSPGECVQALRASGFRILVTHLGPSSVPIEGMDFSMPSAIVFGNEKSGVSPELLALADAAVVLPLTGFVQSYNISVAAAMALHVADRARRAAGVGSLSPDERLRLEADFLIRAVRHADQILGLSPRPDV